MQELNMVVCIKPVPDPEKWEQVTLDPGTKTIRREGIAHIINPPDRNALEAACQLKARAGGKITAVTMGPPSARESLREALALGADRAALFSDSEFAGADTLATSYTLAAGIRAAAGNPDLVLCGARSLDGSTAQVGPQLAVHLNFAHITSVSYIDIREKNRLIARMQLEDGYLEYAARPPLVLTVNNDCNQPESATLMGIMEAENKELTTFNAADLQVKTTRLGHEGSPTRAADIFYPRLERKCEILQGDTGELASTLIQRLVREGALYS